MPILGILASSKLTAADGDYESIATVTVGSGGAADITFSSIAADWTHLQLRYISRGTDSSENNTRIQLNSDTGGNYASHYLLGDGSGTGAGSEVNATYGSFFSISNSSRLANSFAAGVIDILDYANTNKFKTLRILSGREDNTAGIVLFTSNLWRSTNAITTIKVYPGTGNFAQYSHFALYGIKSA